MWKDIKGFEGLYKISKNGEIISLSREMFNGKVFFISKEKKLKPYISGRGYLYVTLTKNKSRKSVPLHRLLAIHFIKNDDYNKVVNHKDNNKLNNNLDNLEWVNHDYNIIHGWSFKEKKSKYPGLCKTDNNKWRARITINGKTIGLGTYNTEEEAHKAYQKKRKELGR